MSRQEDFRQEAIDYDDSPDLVQRIIARTGFEIGCEHGYQYAKQKIEDYLLCVELSNFFPNLSDEEADKGKEELIKAINEFLDEL